MLLLPPRNIRPCRQLPRPCRTPANRNESKLVSRRTGRVSQQPIEEKQRAQTGGMGLDSGSAGSGGGELNAFGRARLLASNIQSALNRFDARSTSATPSTTFEKLDVDGNDATELEERAAASLHSHHTRRLTLQGGMRC